MTPAARIQAAIEILDQITDGEPAEKALTTWARNARFAGSKDRAAIRDHVFDVLRQRSSCAAVGGDDSGRGLMIGLLTQAGADLDSLFTGEGHAPLPMTEAEKGYGHAPEGADALDIPEWLFPLWRQSLGDDAAEVAAIQRHRAPVFLRVNLRTSDIEAAVATLAVDGIVAVPHPLSPTALEVTENARRIKQSPAYLTGQVELQDAASQALVDALPLPKQGKLLDYCAGGGGKTLAMAALTRATMFAHDANPQRMKDLPDRADRAEIAVRICRTTELRGQGPFDLVLCDAPCSGSGSWRRAPEGKWRLTQALLDDVTALQAQILRDAAPLVAAGGALAYATCSVLEVENHAQVQAFLADHPGWTLEVERLFTPLMGGDGFFVAVFRKP